MFRLNLRTKVQYNPLIRYSQNWKVWLTKYSIGHDASIVDFVTLYGNVNVSGNVSIGQCAEIGVGTFIIQ